MPILLPEDMERPLPNMYRVRQEFDSSHLSDVAGAVREQMAKPEIQAKIRPGMRVAVAVGSRGIQNLCTIVKSVIDSLKQLEAIPFIVSAMGSHGEGTESGQRAVLAGYGITEERMGVPVVTSMDTVPLGQCEHNLTVWFDRTAWQSDLIIPINRIKLHTDFEGPLQSGLCKMLVIGLGNHKGCSAVHENPPQSFSSVIEAAAQIILKKAPVGFGLAVLENAYEKTFQVEAIPAENLIPREKELLRLSRTLMPYLMLEEADVILCEEIGKDISGAGFDTNVLGRSCLRKHFSLPVPKYQRLVLLGLTQASHGNGIGVGLFDVITRRVAEQLDLNAMYANAVACNCLADVSIPCTVDSEEQALRVALKCCRGIDRDAPRVLRIKNTLCLDEIMVSEALLGAVRYNPRLTLLGKNEL